MWDFDNDTLPIVLEEDLYIEIILYAKWSKNNKKVYGTLIFFEANQELLFNTNF